MSKTQIDDTLDILPGDSVLVIGADGTLKKLIMPELHGELENTLGKERVLEILQLFNPEAHIEVLGKYDKRKLN